MQTILVCDDDKEIVDAIEIYLSQDGYKIYKAYDGEQAIQILDKEEIHLLIMDIMMPGMDGLSAMAELRRTSNVPVILLTAKNTIQSRLEGLELGADAYLDKPFSTNLLMAQISNLISNRDNIRKFYFNSPIANMKSMAYTKADESFLEKLNEIINERLQTRTTLYHLLKCHHGSICHQQKVGYV